MTTLVALVVAAGGLFATDALLPTVETASVAGDADDPALWIHPVDSSKSLVIGTDKVGISEGGGLYVFGLDGRPRQDRLPLDRPNNVDVEQNVRWASGAWDVAVATERGRRRLAIFRVDRKTGRLSDATGETAVFKERQGEGGAPMGIALYKRPKDGALFAFVSPKQGPTEGYLEQYRLLENGGRVDTVFVRKLGACRPGGEIEALMVDDELGYLYAAEEKFGIRKYLADPDRPDSGRELAVLGKTGFPEDREGLGLVATGPGKGWILCSDQRPGGSYLRIFPRSGPSQKERAAVLTASDATDGLDATARSLNATFAGGMVAMMHSEGRSFRFYRWADIAREAGLSAR